MFFKQRLGKTWIAAGAIERLTPSLTLVIAPAANLKTTWVKTLRELVPHAPLHYAMRKGRTALLALLDRADRGVLLLSYEAVASVIKQLCRRAWNLVIVDEAQRAKDRSSVFSRALAKLAYAERRVLLTGTPIEDRPQDLWAQFRFLVPELFGAHWATFADEYLTPLINPWKERRKGYARFMRALMKARMMKKKQAFLPGMLSVYLAKLRPYCWREELPSPEPAFHIEHVKLLGEQQRIYDTLQRKGVVRLEDGTRIMVDFEMTKREKLRQITSGFVYDEDKEVHWVGQAKQRRLTTLLARLERPLVVACRYVPEIESVVDRLGERVGLIYGGVKREEREEAQRAFQAGELDEIVIQVKTGGVGIDLYRAKSMIVMSSTFSSIDFDQVIARIRLPEQKDPVDIYLILAKNTVDEDRQQVIFGKNRRISKVLRNFRR